MHPLESYLATLTTLPDTTVPETSHYTALETLLTAIGDGLRPRVIARTHPKDTGAGFPDLALYDENQPDGGKPARGVIEAKPIAADLLAIARDEQVARYVGHYGQALVTNFYQFVLVTRAADGAPTIEERYDLADSPAAFWQAVKHPRALAARHEAGLREYLLRVMRRSTPIAAPRELAWFLASYAREAKARISADDGGSLSALRAIRTQLEAALGIQFESGEGEEFFRSTLVQTLFYGLFSAWVLWHERTPGPAARFDLWRDTRRLNIPVIGELFEQFSTGSALSQSVEELLNWTTAALNRVDRPAFFASFQSGGAVQYFYEPFLEAFDPALREQLGVWYTPPEIVDYMVARVDRALRTDLNIPLGLADPNVYILDPCCGTGAYLVAALRHIHAVARAHEGEVMAGRAVQTAMRERIFGFEILPAPFVVAHLQIGMLLNQVRAPLAAGQRAGVYLTNALTGWEAGGESRTALMFPELQRERDAAAAVKQQRPILVILGNPPYSGYAGVAVHEEAALTTAYRQVRDARVPAPNGQGLNDLYVRFFRMAERRIVEGTGQGIISFISNYSWLDGLSHPGMRERYLDAFDTITIDNLNGDRYKTGKRAPDGSPDPSMFSTEFNREGIQVGTAIATLIRTPQHVGPASVRYRSLWGTGKRAQLAAETHALDAVPYQQVTPAPSLGLPFAPLTVSDSYLEWPKLTDLFPTWFPGVETSRDSALVDIDKDKLVRRLQRYFDPHITEEELLTDARVLVTNAARFDARQTREYLTKRGFLPQHIVRFCYRPFDVRWLYWEPQTKLLNEKRSDYYPHVRPDNLWLVAQPKVRRDWTPPQVVRSLGGRHLDERGTFYFPLYLYPTNAAQSSMFTTRRANLSDRARAYLESVGFASAEDGAETLFYHALAVMHAPAYRAAHAGALRQDWARIPLPASRAALEASAAIGREVAALLDPETPVQGVTHGMPRPDLAGIAVLETVAPGAVPDFTVSAGWGSLSRGAVMPGRGLTRAAADGALDIHLNAGTVWRGVPPDVWGYTLGGYQVLKKWLSYRESRVLGRALADEEVREFSRIARRIAALLALAGDLDARYAAVGSREKQI